MASPMDFDEPIIVMAATAEEWIEHVAASEQLPSVTLDHWPWVDSTADEALSKQYPDGALHPRLHMGLSPIPQVDVDADAL